MGVVSMRPAMVPESGGGAGGEATNRDNLTATFCCTLHHPSRYSGPGTEGCAVHDASSRPLTFVQDSASPMADDGTHTSSPDAPTYYQNGQPRAPPGGNNP